MPSTKNPNALRSGSGKLPANTVTATAQLFPAPSAGTDTLLTVVGMGNASRPGIIGTLADYTVYTSAGETSKVLNSGNVWLGDNAGDRLEGLFQVVRSTAASTEDIFSLEPVLADNGAVIKVASISGASIGDEFVDASSSNITVNFTAAIPVGVDYRILHATPYTLTNVANLQRDSLMRAAGALGPISKQDIGSALASGLDDRYRRSTGLVDRSVSSVDTPGSGAEVYRDGPSVKVTTPMENWQSFRTPDPFLAAYSVSSEAFDATAEINTNGGDIGLLNITTERSITGSGSLERTSLGKTRSATGTVLLRDLRSNSISGGTTYTYIPANTTATLNPAGAGTFRVKLDSPYYFKTGGGSTAVYSGVDYLEVTFADNTKQAYILDISSGSLGDDEALLYTPAGAIGGSFSADTPVTVTWYSTYFLSGGMVSGPMAWYQPKQLTSQDSDWTGEGTQPVRLVGHLQSTLDLLGTNALFEVQSSDEADTRYTRLQMTVTGDVVLGGTLGGDGEITAKAVSTGGTGIFYGAFAHRTYSGSVSTDTGTHQFIIDPRGLYSTSAGAGASLIYVELTATPSLGIATVELFSYRDGTFDTTVGTEVQVVVENTSGQLFDMSWSSSGSVPYVFSDPSDATSNGASGVAGAIIRWKLTAIPGNPGIKWLVERMDYLP